jgi:hypothetical protein
MARAVYKTFNCNALTGGATRSLDAITKSGLIDGDRDIAAVGGQVLYFKFNAASTDATNVATHPFKVRPFDYGAGPGVWIEQVPAVVRTVQIRIVAKATDCTVDDEEDWNVPDEFNGMNLIRAVSIHDSPGVTGSTTMGILNVTDAQEMLSVKAAVETGETSSRTSATPGTIDTAHDDVATGDKIRFYIDGISTTAPKGWTIEAAFALPMA